MSGDAPFKCGSTEHLIGQKSAHNLRRHVKRRAASTCLPVVAAECASKSQNRSSPLLLVRHQLPCKPKIGCGKNTQQLSACFRRAPSDSAPTLLQRQIDHIDRTCTSHTRKKKVFVLLSMVLLYMLVMACLYIYNCLTPCLSLYQPAGPTMAESIVLAVIRNYMFET